MAASMVLAHVRLVRAHRRADTRASTEPHTRRATTESTIVVDTTTPYTRDYEPERQGRESVPYCELEVTTERTTAAPFDSGITTGRYVRPLKRAQRVHPHVRPHARPQPQPLPLPEPLPQRPAQLRPSARASAEDMSSLGVVLGPPQVGAALVIGSWLRPEFCVTSPVTHTSVRDGGVVVETASGSRYFVYYAGDAYVVRKLD